MGNSEATHSLIPYVNGIVICRVGRHVNYHVNRQVYVLEHHKANNKDVHGALHSVIHDGIQQLTAAL